MSAKKKSNHEEPGSTPLMRQYYEIKARHKNTLLLYRMGDFYETFDEDARKANKVLGITLTKRSNGKASSVDLAGFPYHSLDTYLPKLVKAGLRVAICEQIEDPKFAKGIVKRDVTEVVTPGTVFSDSVLTQNANNFLAAVVYREKKTELFFGLCFVDASTGDFYVGEFPEREFIQQLQIFRPAEIIMSHQTEKAVKPILASLRFTHVVTKQEDWLFSYQYTNDVLLEHFKTHSLKGFGLQNYSVGVCSAGAAIHYLRETQLSEIQHINSLRLINNTSFVTLDEVTLKNLDVLSSTDGGQVQGSLTLNVDRTQTAMGGRMIRHWITHPLKDRKRINERLNAVEALCDAPQTRDAVHALFSKFADLERLISKVCTNRVNPREMRALASTLTKVPEALQLLGQLKNKHMTRLIKAVPALESLTAAIDRVLVKEPAVHLKDGNIVRKGFHQELDELKSLSSNSKAYLEELQLAERNRTGIPSLKIKFNNVFGYYIEVTHTHKDRVPENYIRKQTLTNAERYVTPELKQYEEKILTAEERIRHLEVEIFDALRVEVSGYTAQVQECARIIAQLDCLTGLAVLAVGCKYVKPVMEDSMALVIKEGRHPVVERTLPPDQPFVPNDLNMDEDNQILLITGPNMAGKSCYLRQIGLIVLLAQIGSFVPAAEARIGIVDKIFTRVGASDNMAAGESTFLVEMNETASILNNTTGRSLILLDEIGRGTSTFDGLSIAWAIVEYLHNNQHARPKTLFATHYHELTELEATLKRVRNFNMLVRKYGDKILFLRKIVAGSCDHSYGIEVAKLAGLPSQVISRAHEVMRILESHDISVDKGKLQEMALSMQDPDYQLTIFEDGIGEKLKQKLSGLKIEKLTPLEALNVLNELKKIMDSD